MPNPQLSRKHHTIPEFYQRGFRDVDARLNIVRYDKETGFIVHPRMKQESVILDYYSVTTKEGELTDQIERELLARFEGGAKHVVDKMRQRSPLTDDDRAEFSAFVALMDLRTPWARHKVERLTLAMMRRKVSQIASDPERFRQETARMEAEGLVPAGLNTEEFRNDLLQDVTDEDYFKRWSVNQEFTITSLRGADLEAKYIFSMHWRIFSATSYSKYVTSDHPVAISRMMDPHHVMIGTGVGNPQAQLTFPITKELALLADYSGKSGYRYVVGEEEDVEEVNVRTITSAQRYVYAHVSSPEIMEQVQNYAHIKPEYYLDRVLDELDKDTE